MKFTPAQGIYIIKPLSESTSGISYDSKDPTKLLKGQILSCGTSGYTKYGAPITQEFSAGDVVYFLSYEGNYDWAMIDNKKIYMTEFLDVRSKVEEEHEN